ncbi:hypothetical protein MTO96_006657 [Rhipicephalus appendiculatus]
MRPARLRLLDTAGGKEGRGFDHRRRQPTAPEGSFFQLGRASGQKTGTLKVGRCSSDTQTPGGPFRHTGAAARCVDRRAEALEIHSPPWLACVRLCARGDPGIEFN